MLKFKSKHELIEEDNFIKIITKLSSYVYNKKTQEIDFKHLEIENLPKYVDDIEFGNKIRKLGPNYKFIIKPSTESNLEVASERKNILFLLIEKFLVEVECTKCSKRIEMLCNSELKCKCGNILKIKYEPEIKDHYCGFIEFIGSKFVIFKSLKFIFSCLCGEYYESRNDTNRLKFKCGLNLLLRVIFVRPKIKSGFFLKGKNLPGNGTCKHYKKSFRWFRFPCCNNLYPCDICHDENESHVNEMAVKMICGLCSKEQSVKNNCDCGNDLKKKKSAHWEGGKGNRDKFTMSKKDKKKYRK